MRKSNPEMGIRIGIVTVRDPGYHPNRRLLEAAGQAGCAGVLIHPYQLWPVTASGKLGVTGENATQLPHVILPRQGAQIGETCLALLRHFRCMGIPMVNGPEAVATARNKFLTQQVLTAAGLPCPDTIFINRASGFDNAVTQLGGYPVVVKPVSARRGEGVFLIRDADDARRRVLAALDRERGVMIQRYLAPENRRDIRALVIGGELAFAATLTPRQGEFRANFHLGSDIVPIFLPPELAGMAVAAAVAVDCDVAGVDMMVGPDGRPLIVEVNYSPGFRGMEAANGLDIAGRIVRLAIGRYRETK